jgi:hypothetical protein
VEVYLSLLYHSSAGLSWLNIQISERLQEDHLDVFFETWRTLQTSSSLGIHFTSDTNAARGETGSIREASTG